MSFSGPGIVRSPGLTTAESVTEYSRILASIAACSAGGMRESAHLVASFREGT